MRPDSNRNSFDRPVFTVSRELEYFSERELVLQTGHERKYWLNVALKELVDNALDAAENEDISPDIKVTIDQNSLIVEDNGPGITPEVLTRILNFASKTSSKSLYIGPTRGAQGNALKTILAMPFVLNGDGRDVVDIRSCGIRHTVSIRLDRVQEAVEITRVQAPCDVNSGTVVSVRWPDLASSSALDALEVCRLLQQARDYSFLNPHASFELVQGGHVQVNQSATSGVCQKWRTDQPTSPHWYNVEQFTSLIAAHVAAEKSGQPALYVRGFVAMFRDLSGTAKQKRILDELALTGTRLADVFRDGKADSELVEKLLAVMQRESHPIRPQSLGVLGQVHVQKRLVGFGCNPNSTRYKRIADTTGRTPFVVEAAMGVFTDVQRRRELVTGLNFSPSLRLPFRDLCDGEGLDGLLSSRFLATRDHACVLVHLTAPGLDFADRGKSTVELPYAIRNAIETAVHNVTKEWHRIKEKQFRNHASAEREMRRLMEPDNRPETIRSIVERRMTEVYAKVSGPNALPAAARQLYYAMRVAVLQELPDANFDSQYFTQGLLPDYLRRQSAETQNWKVVFDARGNLIEPHTGRSIPLGTIAARNYCETQDRGSLRAESLSSIPSNFPTRGPRHRYRVVIFIEKEGFMPLLKAAKIAERFDVAIMSTKGMSSTAARELMESLEGVRFLVLRDFDKAGFSIVGTLKHDTIRYQFKRPPEVIDLGLRLSDVEELELPGEPVSIRGKGSEQNLRVNGATEAEIAYLTGNGSGKGQRVELNAMSSPQFIEWLEQKLKDHSVTKFVPEKTILEEAYAQAQFARLMNKKLQRLANATRKEAKKIRTPKDLLRRIMRYLKQNPEIPWDEAVNKLLAAEG